MAVNITDADAYIGANVLDNEDWTDSDPDRKQRFLNVASRTLYTRYPTYTIPDEAVYETAAAFAARYSDTMVQAQRGVQSITLSGVASFTFRDGPRELAQLIPQTALDLISVDPANAGLSKLSRRNVGWSVL
ncbi:hypothetical protein G3578_10060 [Brevibacillus sp. SYP-B805]|uniref:hypothetical protein n=1 Tax=Brevibacillus sp. SYP-B805 TaxID=1578199 RepID=UPI0013EDDE51|nr:hypothetical protein [Brevibacillus sp. SYP-B805]NGQ95496.1 hypothetical protein [Brevibacillus sp. SYP-B805]